MAEISDWSPIDDDNNMAPPVGWPEGMMPSAVNNTARGMMGTLRRMYDNIVSGVQALPYLPLVGGTVSGNVAINGTGGVSLQTTVLRNISNGLEATNPAGGGITSRGPGAGLTFGDRDQVTPGWIWYAQSGVAALGNGANRISVDPAGNTNVGGNFGSPGNITANGTVSGAYVSSSGNVNAVLDVTARDLHASRNIWASSGTVTAAQLTSNNNINASGSIAASLDVTANRNISAAGTIYTGSLSGSGGANFAGSVGAAFYDCDGTRVIDTSSGAPLLYRQGGVWAIQLQSTNTYYDNQGHIFRNQGAANTFTIDVSGNANATGQVQGSSVYSRADIQAAGQITTGSNIIGGFVQSTGTVYANGTLDANYVNSRGDAVVAGLLTAPRINMSGALQTSNWIVPFGDHGCNICLPGLNADSMHAYAFVVPSDAKLKADIEAPEGCLGVVQAAAPRTYRLPGAPDPAARHWGLLAQEVGAAMQAAGCDYGVRRVDKESGEEGLAVNEVVAVLWGAVREMAARLDSLEGAR